MSDLPQGWKEKALGALALLRRGITYSADMLVEEDAGLPYVNMKSFNKGGGFNKNGLKFFNGPYVKDDLTASEDLLIANTDVTPDGDIVGIPAYLPFHIRQNPVLFSHHVTRIKFSGNEVSSHYLYYLLNIDEYRRWMHKYARGTTVMMLDMTAIKRIPIRYPACKNVQKEIVKKLEVFDTTIEKTEALIHKYQQIKAGLMHDLFTRGLTADGKLRPPREQAPELYQETPIGWIPKDWDYAPISSIMESLVDGPFGSNLKTEHYVIDPGVRVVRLQNIQATNYNDTDKAYVSERHANYLMRNKVSPGDILIAGLGEDRYPVGRACQYPKNLPPAINKADCFRLRCRAGEADNYFVMLYLNTPMAKKQIRRYEQGVTRPRINSGNMKKIVTPKPLLNEQNEISKRLFKLALRIEQELFVKDKLKKQKSGLMHDLLTGKVPVKLDQEEPAHG